MTKALRQSVFAMIVVVFGASAARAQTSPSVAWDEDSAAVDGYAVTVDGARTDFGLAPADPTGVCGCSVPLPFTGGAHTVVVSAYNASGETPAATITTAPTANAGGPYAGTAGTAIGVSGANSSSPLGTLTTYAWNWGDGSNSTGTSPSASHTYAAGGTFPITLTVTDNGGATATASTVATITAATPAPGAPTNPSPGDGATNIGTSTTLKWSASGATSYDVRFGTSSSPSQVAAGIATATYAAGSLTAGTTYYWQIVARNSTGTTSGPVWSFTTAIPTPSTPPSTSPTPSSPTPSSPTPSSPTPSVSGCPCSVWSTTTKPGTQDPESRSLEIGMKFRSDVAGNVTGVRFYKYAANTGNHTGTLWSASGQKLATVMFKNESESGWQQADFSTPVHIAANTTYVISYHTSIGYYASTEWGFNNGVDHGPLHALSSGSSGGNGVYVWGRSAFPNQTWHASNYWVDVVFTP